MAGSPDGTRLGRWAARLPRRAAIALGAAAAGEALAAGPADARTRKRRRPNPCQERNWCVDRSHTCGESASGKCLVGAFGGNACAEILFQVEDCAECEPPSCVDCICALAAGGGDRCNNGANGFDFICARPIPAS